MLNACELLAWFFLENTHLLTFLTQEYVRMEVISNIAKDYARLSKILIALNTLRIIDIY